jgi:hypothetical protein
MISASRPELLSATRPAHRARLPDEHQKSGDESAHQNPRPIETSVQAGFDETELQNFGSLIVLATFSLLL